MARVYAMNRDRWNAAMRAEAPDILAALLADLFGVDDPEDPRGLPALDPNKEWDGDVLQAIAQTLEAFELWPGDNPMPYPTLVDDD